MLYLFFNDTATAEIYTLSLHDALPICGWESGRGLGRCDRSRDWSRAPRSSLSRLCEGQLQGGERAIRDRKSTRLNSSHVKISYAVFCLKKKKTKRQMFPSPSR